MRKYVFFIFTLFFSSNLYAQLLNAEYKTIDPSIKESTVSLSNGLIQLVLPTDFLKDAIILAVNSDPTVILNKNEKRAFSISTLGKKEVFEGFSSNTSQLHNSVSDIPSILFGVQRQVIVNNSDEELKIAIKKLHDSLFITEKKIKSYYSKAKDKTVYYYFNGKKNAAFIVNVKNKDYFTLIDSDNLNSDEFINYIVKGVLQ